MSLNDRQSEIVDMLSSFGEVKIVELSRKFAVSEMTIRRDLDKLEENGLLRRTFGGAILLAATDLSLRERTGVMAAEKIRIGRKALDFIRRGQSIFLDAGSTTLQIARQLNPDMKLTVVTNAINIAVELQERQVQTIVVGGMLRESTSSLIGPATEEAIANMAFDCAFLGATGFTVEYGFSNSNPFEAAVKKRVVSRASETNIVLDHTKFGLRSLSSFANLDVIQRLITDCEESALFAACSKTGVELIVA